MWWSFNRNWPDWEQMRKPNREFLVAVVFLTVVLIGLAIFAYKCSTSPRAVVSLAMDLHRKPILDYTGPGLYTEECDVDQFAFQVDLSREVRLTKAQGLFKRDKGSRVSLFLRSVSLEPYNIRLLGFHTNETSGIPPDQLIEIIEMPAGTCGTNLDRYILFMKKSRDDPASTR